METTTETLSPALIVNPSEYGIEEAKAGELLGNLPQIKSERDSLSSVFDTIIKLDIEDPNTAKIAKELRAKIRDNRTKGIMPWHKTTKEVYLRAGQFVDAVKNKEIAVNERMEFALEEIEKYAEKKEAARIDELTKHRIGELTPYMEFVPFGINLGILTADQYKTVFNGAKLQSDAKEESDRKEAERLEAERLAEIERQKQRDIEIENQRLENERLKKETEEKEAQLAKERAESVAKQKAIQAEADRKALEEKQKQDAILKAEQAEKAKLEAELKAKKDAEIKAENERLAEAERQRKEAEKLAKAPIKKQLTVWIDLFVAPVDGVDNEKSREILEKFESFKKWAKSEIEKL